MLERFRKSSGKGESYSAKKLLDAAAVVSERTIKALKMKMVIDGRADKLNDDEITSQVLNDDEITSQVCNEIGKISEERYEKIIYPLLGEDDHTVSDLKDFWAYKGDLNVKNETGRTALMLAALNPGKGVAAIPILVQKGVNLDVRDNDGNTALMIAFEAGNDKASKLLIDAGANLDIRDNTGKTALMLAAEKGEFDVVDALIVAGANLNIRDNAGKTALMLAAAKGLVDLVRILIVAKANLNIRDNDGKTALMLAAEEGRADVVEALIVAKADLNIRDNAGKTALMLAAEAGKTDVVDALIAARANLDIRDNAGRTALMRIMAHRKYGCVGIAKKLVAFGAKLDIKGIDGRDALFLAVMYRVARDDNSLVKDLIKAGASPYVKDAYGNTVFGRFNESELAQEIREQLEANKNELIRRIKAKKIGSAEIFLKSHAIPHNSYHEVFKSIVENVDEERPRRRWEDRNKQYLPKSKFQKAIGLVNALLDNMSRNEYLLDFSAASENKAPSAPPAASENKAPSAPPAASKNEAPSAPPAASKNEAPSAASKEGELVKMLAQAAIIGNGEIVALLLKRGANPDNVIPEDLKNANPENPKKIIDYPIVKKELARNRAYNVAQPILCSVFTGAAVAGVHALYTRDMLSTVLNLASRWIAPVPAMYSCLVGAAAVSFVASLSITKDCEEQIKDFLCPRPKVEAGKVA
jgi:ankyrin repeat protein